MTAVFNQFPRLSDAERLAYLDAMEIIVWVPRNQPESAEVAASIDKQAIAKNENTDLHAESQENFQAADQAKHQADLQSELPTEADKNQSTDPASSRLPKSTLAESSLAAPNRLLPEISGFLKLVGWKSNIKQDKKLLVICRHQKDQPAQSFARANGPSQFMQDLLKTIEGFVKTDKIELQTQLAHLTEAGLGQDNSPFAETISQLDPDLLLILGDESLHHLFASEPNQSNSSVADYRGRLLEIPVLEGTKKIPAIVSYHPYSLIKNPALKRLALEDLAFVANVLKQSEN